MTGAILVGGRARRLQGICKPALHIAGKRIIDRQVSALREAGVSDICLLGPSVPTAVKGVHRFPDAVPDGGAMAGLYTALITAPHSPVIVLAGDMPFVTASLITQLGDLRGHDAVIPWADGRWHPLCAGYHRRVAARLRARLSAGRWRIVDALQDLRVVALSLSPSDTADPARHTPSPLTNVNTPDDLADASLLAR